MKILHTVEFYSPSTGGMQEVVKQISEILVKGGHSVTVATSKLSQRRFKELNGVKIAEFDIKGNYVRGICGDVGKYQDFVINGEFDVVTNFAAQQWATDVLFPVLPKLKSAKIFVPTGFSAFFDKSYKKYFQMLRQWMKQYDANVFLSDDYRDINFARKIGIQKNKIIVIPNGASKKEFNKEYKYNFRKVFGIPKDNLLIITIGSHTGSKGHKEAIEIFRKANIKNSTLVIVGNTLGGGCSDYCKRQSVLSKYNLTNRNKIIVPKLNREETVAALKESDIFLFASNIECSPIVLFEACAAKVPFLSADVGNATEIVKWTKGGVILPTEIGKNGYSHVDINKSVKVLQKLLSNKQLMKKLAGNGYNSWKRNFTWGKISKKYESLYRELLE